MAMNSSNDINPLVSIVTCTYNRKGYLKEAIESVLAQTYKNWEYIIWSDGSSDGTEEMVTSYKDPRIKFFQAGNQGVGPATLSACKHVTGKYIAHLDDDDMFMPSKLEKQVRFLEEHPEYAVVGSSAYYVDSQSNVIGIALHYCDPDLIHRLLVKDMIPVTHSCAMFRTSDYISVGGYPTTKRALDAILWLRLRNAGKFYNYPDFLVKYRIHGNPITVGMKIGPYSQILESIMSKIFQEEGRNEEDNSLYNSLYTKNKQLTEKVDVSNLQQFEVASFKLAAPYKSFLCLSKIVGKDRACRIILMLYDLSGKIKY